MTKFKIGDKVRERPGSHETLSDGWLDRHWAGYWDRSCGTKEEGVYYVNRVSNNYIRYHSFPDANTGPQVPSSSLELVEQDKTEERDKMNLLRIGSKWEFIQDPKFVVEVVQINSSGAPVLKSLSDDRQENIKAGDIFEYQITSENFQNIYAPYKDIEAIREIADRMRNVFHRTRLDTNVTFTMTPEQALTLIEYLEQNVSRREDKTT